MNTRRCVAGRHSHPLLAVTEFHHAYFNRHNLPDLGSFTRFELPTIGHVYDTGGRPLIELAREYREITRYADIPPIVRDAILAAEDKRFFSHNGIDYSSLPRVLGKVRVGMLAGRLVRGGRHDEVDGAALFRQGGSTITQQLVRGNFLRRETAEENSYQLRPTGLVAGLLSSVMGARSVNMLARKREEIRLSLWLEQKMRERFGSKRRAKEEILARYASFVYMGNGQYGFARAAEYYFGRRLRTFTADDADKAALLAGIPKSPRDYAPSAKDTGTVLRRRNQTLTLMRANGFMSPEVTAQAKGRALQIVRHDKRQALQAPAVVEHVLEEFKARHAELSMEDLLQGRIHVYATADARVQHIVNEALEHGLGRYEQRHPTARGMIQGAVVVLQNRDGRVLAETGGRQDFNGRSASYSDYGRNSEEIGRHISRFVEFLQRGKLCVRRLHVPKSCVGVREIPDRLRLLRVQSRSAFELENGLRILLGVQVRDSQKVPSVEEIWIRSDDAPETFDRQQRLPGAVVHLSEARLDVRRQRIELVCPECLRDSVIWTTGEHEVQIGKEGRNTYHRLGTVSHATRATSLRSAL